MTLEQLFYDVCNYSIPATKSYVARYKAQFETYPTTVTHKLLLSEFARRLEDDPSLSSGDALGQAKDMMSEFPTVRLPGIQLTQLLVQTYDIKGD